MRRLLASLTAATIVLVAGWEVAGASQGGPPPLSPPAAKAPSPLQDVPIGAYGSTLLSRAAHVGDVDWLRLDYDGVPASLVASGFAISSSDRIPKLIRFVDPSKSAQADLFATGLRVDGTSITLALKNTTDGLVSATAQFLDPDSGIVLAELPQAEISARSARRLDLASLAAKLTLVPRVAVRIHTTGAAGSLIGDLHADDPSTGLSYEAPLRDSGTDAGSVRRATGNAPWRLDGDYNTRVLFTNVGASTASFVLNITYYGVQDTTKPRELAAGASALFDLRQMRDDGVLEGFRQLIPKRIERGVLVWSIRAPSSARLAGRAEMVSVSQRVTASYTW